MASTSQGALGFGLGDHSRDQLHRCFVLHRRAFRDSSLLVEIFAEDHGRFPVVAKGATSGRRWIAGVIEPFRPVWLSWTGRGEVKTLCRAEARGAAAALQGTALFCGFYLNELLLRLLGRNDAYGGLFARYEEALDRLAECADPAPVLRQFELTLLRELGYAPLLDTEADTGHPVCRDRRYRYAVEQGPIALPDHAEVSDSVSGMTLLGLAAGLPLDLHEAREARQLLRAVLARYLGDRPLKSRELFRRWRQS